MSTADKPLDATISELAGDGISPLLTFVFAIASGTLVANLYYAQGLVSTISPTLGLHGSLAGLPVTLTQLGYAAGLTFLVSLADLIENRRLILLCIAGATIGLIGATLSTNAATFLISSVVIGVGSCGAQVIVPFAAHLAHEHRRGRVIGNVMGGLLAGIMLARPVANLISSALGWRAVFGISAALCVVISVVLWFNLPERRPASGMTYRGILASTWRLLVTTPTLQRRASYQAIMFCVFNLFWTAVPLVLTRVFGFDQRAIALFALAGAGGALAAPIAGRLADRGFTRPATFGALFTVVIAFALSGWAVAAGMVLVLALAAIALDAATQTNQILSQRVIYGLDPHARGRITSVFMTSVFIAGAAGSLLGSATFAAGGWTATAWTGAALGILVLAIFATEPRTRAT
jgi:predicted MFS family arabinose efflux permease